MGGGNYINYVQEFFFFFFFFFFLGGGYIFGQEFFVLSSSWAKFLDKDFSRLKNEGGKRKVFFIGENFYSRYILYTCKFCPLPKRIKSFLILIKFTKIPLSLSKTKYNGKQKQK